MKNHSIPFSICIHIIAVCIYKMWLGLIFPVQRIKSEDNYASKFCDSAEFSKS